MKNSTFFCLTILFLFFDLTLFGQNTISKISYDFHYNLQNYDEGYHYKSFLFYNKNESLFLYNSKVIEGKDSFKKSFKHKNGNIDGGVYFRTFDDKGLIHFYDLNKNEHTSRQLLSEKYPIIVKEKGVDFNWKLTTEKKKIGDYNCIKAISENYNGRYYEAWFTTDIPISFGPYKFKGLPGLILEIYDRNKLIHITATKIETVPNNDFTIKAPVEDEIMSNDEFLTENFRLYEAYIENQKALFATGRMPKKPTPIPYVYIEYPEDQQQKLNNFKTIIVEN